MCIRDRLRMLCLWIPQIKDDEYELDDKSISLLSKVADPKDKRKIASREQKISNIKAGIFTTKKELYFGIEGVGAYKCSGIVSLEDDGVALEQLIGA